MVAILKSCVSIRMPWAQSCLKIVCACSSKPMILLVRNTLRGMGDYEVRGLTGWHRQIPQHLPIMEAADDLRLIGEASEA